MLTKPHLLASLSLLHSSVSLPLFHFASCIEFHQFYHSHRHSPDWAQPFVLFIILRCKNKHIINNIHFPIVLFLSKFKTLCGGNYVLNHRQGDSFCSLTKPRLHHYCCYTHFPIMGASSNRNLKLFGHFQHSSDVYGLNVILPCTSAIFNALIQHCIKYHNGLHHACI